MTKTTTLFIAWIGVLAITAIAHAAEPPTTQTPDFFPVPPPVAEAPAIVTETIPAPLPTGPFLFGEYILVQPRRDNLSMGVLGSTVSGSFESRDESLKYQLADGFRVGGGYRLPTDGLDVTASFAYFHSKFQRTVDAPAGSTIFPGLGLLGAPATSADGDAALSYAVTDLEIGRTFAPADTVAVRLFGGARFARLNQSLKTIYDTGDFVNVENYVNSPVKYLGGGLSVGGDATWWICNRFGVYSKARFSLLAGQFDSKLIENVGGTGYLDIRDSYPTVTPVAELGVGVAYQGPHLFVSVGYDLADWFNMVNGVALPDPNRPGQTGRVRGDLTLEGLSVKMGFIY